MGAWKDFEHSVFWPHGITERPKDGHGSASCGMRSLHLRRCGIGDEANNPWVLSDSVVIGDAKARPDDVT